MGERLVFMAYDSGQCTSVCACELTHGMHYEHKWPRTCNLPLATSECVLLSYTIIHSYIHICYLRHVNVYSNRLHFFRLLNYIYISQQNYETDPNDQNCKLGILQICCRISLLVHWKRLCLIRYFNYILFETSTKVIQIIIFKLFMRTIILVFIINFIDSLRHILNSILRSTKLDQ